MIIGRGTGLGFPVVVRLERGELLLESLREIVRGEGIRNGVILSGFGSLDRSAFTGLLSGEYPATRFHRDRRTGGIEVLNVTGVIADYHVHAHLTLCQRDRAFGGHLDEGCRVLSLCEIVLAEVKGVKLKRLFDPKTKQNLLQVVRSYTGLPATEPGRSLIESPAAEARQKGRRRVSGARGLPQMLGAQ
jgi:predicted DNA-binding protein with PD1-like motif